MKNTLDILREATIGTPYEGRLFLVGGIVRDKLLGLEPEQDIDIVLEGDAGKLAVFLHEKAGVADHPPITYPRFGTAMVMVKGHQVEFVGARKESYDSTSRKPSTKPGTLMDDVLRRDFTINTLLENLHTGEILDLTGLGRRDIEEGIIRTPREPVITFKDDPLRMLRAVRFASRFGFQIHLDTYAALFECADRLSIVSGERIREEFVKIVMSQGAVSGLETLRETKLLDQFAPELSAMHGVSQNIYHIYDVWTHSLKVMKSVPVEAGIKLRLAALMHDVGKVQTRSVDDEGNVHFYGHQDISANIAREIMHRLRFSNSQIQEVSFLISMHMRVGEYHSGWSDSAVRRLLRDVGDHLEDLILLTEADNAAANPDYVSTDIQGLRKRIAEVREALKGQEIKSPLNGREIIDFLEISPGPQVGEIKSYLESQIVEGNLLPDDKDAARKLLLDRYGAGPASKQ